MAIKYRKTIRRGEDLRESMADEMSPDPSLDDRWNEGRYRRALGEALEFVGNKLRTPFIYRLDASLSTGNRFLLPDYIEGPIDLQRKTYSRYSGGDGDSGYPFFHETIGYEVYEEPSGLWLEPQFFANGDELRLVYWPTNPPYPRDEVVLLADLASTDDSLTLDTSLDNVGRSGYVNVGGEVLMYQGVQQESTTKLLNLNHSINGMVVTTHPAGTEVDFCVATHDAGMYQILKWWGCGWLHGTYLNRSSQQEREMHDMQQRLYIQLAKDHLRDSWQPARSPRMRLDRVAAAMAGHDNQDYR